ncbi:DCP2-domain-containing protein [Punctularia strigosozonata HHB-11173 SS5]|uniref:DCP2-domain-containing protein n=1 Tax=Punctularia strigosozonata (strain HHB-11173) TaxID=741275 RepID=UPI00044162BD|nr:DCP2-domain-containing protein [Punctularia strigosozonata HHB-11173 SS5]EIN13760.1 DCP2-domain-containing protein [Punctularia strigosozonata HHB-11173 SS5]
MASSSTKSSPQIATTSASKPPDNPLLVFANINEALDNLASRFILNLPQSELDSIERICFQVEQAHWFYEDFVREQNHNFPHINLKKFSSMMFHRCPLLQQHAANHEASFSHFMQYKIRVPVCGAIMLNPSMDKCVLVKGWKQSSGWGFPKGKINQEEDTAKSNARLEVLEETGYNISEKLQYEDVIEMSMQGQRISLYIICGVPEDFEFKTRTRKEISKIEWFKLTELPTWKSAKQVSNRFYLVAPFVNALKAYVHDRKPRRQGTPNNKETKDVPKAHISNNAEGSSRRDARARGAVHGTTNLQESSHHSSSVDKVVTPTPSVVEPRELRKAQNSAIPHFQGARQETSPGDQPGEAVMDAHMARILHTLQLSAEKRPESVTRPEDQPLPASSADATHLDVNRGEQSDWSMRSPQRLSENRPLPPETQSTSVIEVIPFAEQGHNVISQNALSLNPSTLISAQAESTPGPLSAVPSVGTQSSTSGDASTSVRAQSTVSRRSSTSAAGLSPYLSKPTEMPVSGKQLKQLALLESVADESARMTPILGHRASQVFAAARNSPVTAAAYPDRPFSVIPNQVLMHGHPLYNGSTIPYSASPRALAFPHHQAPVSGMNFNGFPIQERPRSSATVRPFHAPNPMAGNRASMDHHQLHAMLSRPRTMMPPTLPNPQPTSLMTPLPGPPLDALSPLQGMGFAPQSTPLVPVHVPPSYQQTSAQTPSSANLLSILNASPNGVSNGMGP